MTKVNPTAIAALQKRGLSAQEIALELRCSKRTVTRWRGRLNMSAPLPDNAGRRATPERLAAAERLFNDGASQQEVASTLGFHTRTLAHHFPGRGWSMSEGGKFAATAKALKRLQPFTHQQKESK